MKNIADAYQLWLVESFDELQEFNERFIHSIEEEDAADWL